MTPNDPLTAERDEARRNCTQAQETAYSLAEALPLILASSDLRLSEAEAERDVWEQLAMEIDEQYQRQAKTALKMCLALELHSRFSELARRDLDRYRQQVDDYARRDWERMTKIIELEMENDRLRPQVEQLAKRLQQECEFSRKLSDQLTEAHRALEAWQAPDDPHHNERQWSRERGLKQQNGKECAHD